MQTWWYYLPMSSSTPFKSELLRHLQAATQSPNAQIELEKFLLELDQVDGFGAAERYLRGMALMALDRAEEAEAELESITPADGQGLYALAQTDLGVIRNAGAP